MLNLATVEVWLPHWGNITLHIFIYQYYMHKVKYIISCKGFLVTCKRIFQKVAIMVVHKENMPKAVT